MPTAANAIPTLQVHGSVVPRLGFGTWRLSGIACREAVATALSLGYRHIDTAAMYGNEVEVGAALAASGQARDTLFVTTKVWRDDLRPDDLLRSAEASLDRLKLDHVDLLLIHWPNAAVPLSDTMAALNEAADRGWTRHVGVSNLPVALLREARQASRRPIFANQCEYHPGLDQTTLIQACQAGDTAFVAYRPLGQGRQLADPLIVGIAERHGVTPSQVVLRWHMQQPDLVAIPRSANPAHIAENAAVFDFVLTESEMDAIFRLSRQNDRHVQPDFAPVWDAPAWDAP
ncbi:aldo/keto reductase [Lichenifustis flavocetrariae]|uniref:Aldo/keto reductase n=1 Tax=Lichenifustis flavocetrariae TaxID=2949735 RepID=A0AA41YY00_9HYPH|nr:aldo/keto reductase [Lichenifustis flavocetrariae]MCW6509103.1 aldo/keto reductase [Lichenifustis flavocetrariae]